MKRSVILSLFAVALTALCATTAQAAIDVQLNLFYTDPADPSQGGTWDLLVKSDGANGVAGLKVHLDGTSGVTGIDTPLSAVTPNPPVWADPNSIFRFRPVGGGSEIEVVGGDDLAGPFLLAIGKGSGTPGNVAVDDLGNSFWDNSALIASGTFGATRPTITEVEANEFGGDPNNIAAAAPGLKIVRGDSLNTLGLELPAGAGLIGGDANRDLAVGGFDFTQVLVNFSNTIAGRSWLDGDSDADGFVRASDFTTVLINFDVTGAGYIPPAIGAVPEPSTLVLLAVAGLGLAFRRRE